MAVRRVRSSPAPQEEPYQLLSKFFRGLGDPTRLKILILLMERERHVGELVEQLGVAQGRVSTHLACLRWCGYVQSRREGNRVFYAVTDERVRKILDLAQKMLAKNAKSILSCQRIT